jgi:surface antigen
MQIARLGIAAALTLGLAACADYGTKQTAGTLVGAGTGAFIGSQIGHGTGRLVATGLGTLLGAWAGNEIGKSLDRADQAYASRAEYDALEYNRSGESQSWNNPDSGHYGYVTPQQAYQNSYGQYCREYSHTVYVGGQPQRAYGTACRQADGSWQIVS